MDACFSNLKRLLFLVGAVMVISCAQAQSTTQPSQPIIFSTPDNDASSAPPLSAPAPIASGLPDALKPSVFNFAAPQTAAVPLPAPQAAAVSPDDFDRLQKLMDERKNWALLTPAEVLGIPTQEKILGIPERGAAGQEKNLTVVERYYERQNQSQAGHTNGYQDDAAAHWNLPDDQNDGGSENPAHSADSFFNNNTPDNNNAAASQQANADSGDFFAAPTRPAPATTSANLEQQAEMERFRQLLDPPPKPVAATKSSSGGSVFQTPQTDPDSFFGQTPANPNPVGGSFTPLGSGVGGLPVSADAGIQNPKPPAVTPSWVPQPPPWLSSTPQPGVMPQRKF